MVGLEHQSVRVLHSSSLSAIYECFFVCVYRWIMMQQLTMIQVMPVTVPFLLFRVGSVKTLLKSYYQY